MDLTSAKEIFQEAYSYYLAMDGAGAPEPEAMAYASVTRETVKGNKAIEAMRNVKDIDWSRIEKINTLIHDGSLWKNYMDLKAPDGPSGLVASAVEVGVKRDISDSELRDRLLQMRWDAGEVDLLKESHDPDSAKFAMKSATLRTRAPRFWAGIQAGAAAYSADRVLALRGVTGFKEKQWVIEAAYAADKVKGLLDAGTTGRLVKRPSALCVNDESAPRFRALTPSERGTNARGERLTWHGTTMDLGEWKNVATKSADGIAELMCPNLPWGEDFPPSRLTLIGRVTDVTAEPTNDEFAQYLSELYLTAMARHDEFVDLFAV